MIKSNATIRQFEENDFEKIFPLFSQAYKFNPRMQERDYCDWQFKNTPFSQTNKYSLLVMEVADQVTGFIGYLPVQYRLYKELFYGCIVCSWYSFGSTSGIRLLSELMSRNDNMFYFDFSPDSEAVFKMFQMPMCSLSRWVGILDAPKVHQIFSLKLRPLEPSVTNQVPVEYCQRFDDSEEFGFDQWPGINGYICRTGKYLNWRYVDIPRHNYQLLRWNNEFAVIRVEQIKNYQEKVIRILEWTFTGLSSKKALSMIIDKAKQEDAILIDFISSATSIGQHFQTLGFLKTLDLDKDLPYLFRPIRQSKEMMIAIDLPPHRTIRNIDFSQWYITKGDSDMDRIKL